MRRFLLYKRGQVWPAQVSSPTTKEHLSGKPTGEVIVAPTKTWFTIEVSVLVQMIRKAQLVPADAGQIVRALKDHETEKRNSAVFQPVPLRLV